MPALLTANSSLSFGLLFALAVISAAIALFWVPRLPKATELEPAVSGLSVCSGLRGAGDGDGLELETEVANPSEDAVQLGLVGDFAHQLSGADASHKCHPVEGRREAIAQPAANDDPNAACRVHASEIPATLRERTSPTADVTQGLARCTAHATVAVCHPGGRVAEA